MDAERSGKVVAADIPCFKDYLSSLVKDGEILLETLDGLLEGVVRNEYTTEYGISLLDVKYHCLIDYLINIVIIARLKLAGQKTAECSARLRLVEDRIVMEKSTTLEHKIKYQMDKLLQQSHSISDSNPLTLKPNVDDLETNAGEDSSPETEENTVMKKYIPPRIAASHYDLDGSENDTHRQKQAREKALKKSSIILDLARESSELPMEISERSAGRRRVTKDREERRKYEETNLTRINLTKKQKNSERLLMRASELDTITKFSDIRDLEGKITKPKSSKRKATGGKSKSGKKWKRFKK